jgi:hypothetical protein
MNRRGPTIPFALRAIALQGRQTSTVVGDVEPASPPGVLPPSGIGQAPRLPGQPIVPFDPGTPPLIPPANPPNQGYGTDIEAQRIAVPMPKPVNDLVGVFNTFSNEVTVYQTQSRWRGIDVYVDDNAISAPHGVATLFGIPNTGVLVTRVYGYAQGSGWNLVSQGMLGFWGAQLSARPMGFLQGRGTWVCAARAVCEKFAVTVQYYDTFDVAGLPVFPTGNLMVTVAAADESVPVPYDVGAVYAAGPQGAVPIIDLGTAAPGANIVIPRIELLYVQAVNTSAAARYLLGFSRVSAGLAAGTHADMVWPLGPGAGYGFAGPERFTFGPGMTLAISSTAPLYTAAADSAIQALIR